MSNVDVQPVSPGPYPPPGYYPPPRQSGCLVAVTVLLLFLLGASVLANMVLVGRSVGAMSAGSVEKPGRLSERWVAGEGEAKAVLIELSGVILDEVRSDGLFGLTRRPVERIRRELEQAEKDDAVKAVIFAVDSPGGTITASDEILHLFQRFKKNSGKKVVVRMGGVAASGGYYVSSAADVILAEPTTITGSIGVILQTFNLSKALEWMKVENLTIKSGANKDLLNPFQPVNEEHVRILQNVIDRAYDRFVHVVSEGRGIPEDEVRRLADGRIYTAQEALDRKLIDGIGYLEDAIEKARALARVEKLTVVKYSRVSGFLAALAGDPDAEARVEAPRGFGIDAVFDLARPRLCYLWAPAAAGAAK
jgi:protease-4